MAGQIQIVRVILMNVGEIGDCERISFRGRP